MTIKYITQKELANKLGISQQALNYHIKKGAVKTKEQFGKILVDVNTVLKLRKSIFNS